MNFVTKPTIKPSLQRYMHLSFEEARRCIHDRALLRTYEAVWTWSGVWFGGTAGVKHECFWRKFGRVAYYARINKVRAACGFEAIVDATS